MTGTRTYLDWNATTPLLPSVRLAMIEAMDRLGNPSSVHQEGRTVRAMIDRAREHVAALVKADPANVIFTSGGTEAATMVLRSGFDGIALAAIEHAAIRGAADRSGARIAPLPVAPDGKITVDALRTALLALTSASTKSVVAIQSANNETGILQDVPALAAEAASHGAAVLCDTVQSLAKLPVDITALGADAITVSAHKFGGPKGVGALITSNTASAGPLASLTPLIHGGGQERGRRGGTENVLGIVGFGEAARLAQARLVHAHDMRQRRDALEHAVLQASPDTVVIGKSQARLPNTSMLACPGLRAETLVIRLDLAGIAISAGAACSSGKVGTNPVLMAMGIDPPLADSAIRVSIGPETTDAECNAFVSAWAAALPRNARRAA